MSIPAALVGALQIVDDHPESVRRLRQLVVALAITGKLNEQGHDRNGTEKLLKLLGAQQQKVTREGTPDPAERLRPIPKAELPDVCPSGTLYLKLGDVARIVKGLTSIAHAAPGGYPLVATAERRATCDHYDFDAAAAIVPLVSSAGHGKASLQRLHYQEGKFALGSILAAIIPHAPDLLSARFIYEYLSAFKDELLVSQMIGTANVSLSLGKVASTPIPVVSPAVQKKVDDVMSLCDELEAARDKREAARDRLAMVTLARLNSPDPENISEDASFAINALPPMLARPEQLKHLRHAILNLAVRGLLVPQDRHDEEASALLERIANEKANDCSGATARRRAALPALDARQAPFDLPPGWAWARFPELGVFGRGKSKHRPRNDPALFVGGSHRVIQTGDVARSGGLIRTHTSKYNDVGLAQSHKWPVGTLCITIAANIADSGILAFDACFPDSVVGFVPSPVLEGAEYFEYFVRTAKANLLEFAPATAQKNINLEILESVLIPLPPLNEKRRIVERVGELMSICDQLERSLVTGKLACARLLTALLNNALEASEREDEPEAEVA